MFGAWMIWLQVKSGEVSFGFTVIRRKELPLPFWAQIGFHMVIAMSCLGSALAFALGWLPRH